MESFLYRQPVSTSDAHALLAEPGAAVMGGGTDLLPLIRDARIRPRTVVDLRRVEGLAALAWEEDGALRIGAATRLATLARDPLVGSRLPSLAQACAAVGSHQLRNMGTIGGNLGQRPRCWYFRNGHSCHKNGGSRCPASTGENQYHAVFQTGPCVAVHPSDPAVALTALEATVQVTSPRGDRSVSISDIFTTDQADREILVAPDEFIASITVPGASSGGRQRYDKLMQRGAWDFALVSLAATRRADGDVRLVLGGVAARPWRVTDSIEEDVASGGLSDDDVETLAQRALYDAAPLPMNGYKVLQAAALLRRGIRFLIGSE